MGPPPKRALFSLNLESEAESVYQRIEDHNKDGDERVRVLESSGPTTGKTQLEFLTKPFEKIVDRTIEGVVEGTGKRLDSVDGNIREETHRSDNRVGTSEAEGHWKVVKKTSRVGNRSSTSKKNRIWEEYDTSEL